MDSEKTASPLKRRWRPKERSPKVKWTLTVVLLLLAAMGLTAVCLMTSTLDFSRGRFSSYFHEPVILLLNFLPVALLILFFYFATNRAWLSFLIPSVLLLIMGYIHYFKVALRGEPFVIDDLFLLGEGMGMMGNYAIIPPVWFYVSVALILGGTVVLLLFARGRVPKQRWWVRLLAAAACIGFGAFSWVWWYSDNGLYDRQENTSLFNVWKDTENYASHGFLYSFLHSVSTAIMPAPEGYSKEAAQTLLSGFADQAIPADRQVNVVVTMLESFSDLSELESIDFTADAYADFHALQTESYHGSLLSDTCGGGTINAERAFLTGFSFPQPHYRNPSSSFVRYFSACGYQTDGSHPGNDWFYSRVNVNERLGFDRYLFMENHYAALTEEEHASDAVLFPELRRIYEEETADGEPYFSFSVTYQNHSPYENERLEGGEYVSHAGISDEAYYLVNNYLNGVADTGRQLAAYVDSFRDDETPVVLVFFGDHKPSFGAENCYYEEMGVNVLEGTAEGCRNLYSTPYLIWANDAAKELLGNNFTGRGGMISPCYLMSVVFDQCGWEGPAWMQLQRQVREVCPVMHQDSMYLSADGSLTDSLPETAVQAHHDYAVAEYYLRKTLVTYSFQN